MAKYNNVADIISVFQRNGLTINDVEGILVDEAKHLSLIGSNASQVESEPILEELRLFLNNYKRQLLRVLDRNCITTKNDMEILRDIGLAIMANLKATAEEKVQAGEKLVQQFNELMKKEDETVAIMSESIDLEMPSCHTLQKCEGSHTGGYTLVGVPLLSKETSGSEIASQAN